MTLRQQNYQRIKAGLEVQEKFKELNLNKDGFCLVPFTTLILEPNGSVGVCRQKGTEFSIGNIKETPIDEIWNNHFIRQWRKEFLDGKPNVCKDEIQQKHCNLCPQNNQMLDYVSFEEFQKKPFIKLTANFNGKCNLQCQMCHVWKLPNGLYDEINFWGPAKNSIFPFVKEIDLLSGEPFIQPDTYRLIQQVHEVNPDCKWMFTTNAHWKLNQKIKDHLNKIFVKYIVLSVDSLDPQTYHKIRYPGNLSIVLENIDSLLQYNNERVQLGLNKIEFNFNFLVQKDNWQEVKNVIHYCLDKDILPFITYLYEPVQFSLNTLDMDKKAEILDFYFETLNVEELNIIMRVLLPLIASLSPALRAQYYLQIQQSRQQLSMLYKEQIS